MGLPTPAPALALPQRYRYGTEELRVDIDGRAPTMTVSGVIPGGLFTKRLTWIARVKRTATGTYKGKISYRDGTSSLLPQTQVEVALSPLPTRASVRQRDVLGRLGSDGDASFRVRAQPLP